MVELSRQTTSSSVSLFQPATVVSKNFIKPLRVGTRIRRLLANRGSPSEVQLMSLLLYHAAWSNDIITTSLPTLTSVCTMWFLCCLNFKTKLKGSTTPSCLARWSSTSMEISEPVRPTPALCVSVCVCECVSV